jgi:hypothetical protein
METNKTTLCATGRSPVYGLVIMAVVQVILVSVVQFITSNIKYSLETRSKEQALQSPNRD